MTQAHVRTSEPVPSARPQQRNAAQQGCATLIVGINYWPEPTGIAPYTTALAEYLAQHGDPIEVLTGLPSYPEWRVPASYRHGVRFREHHNGVDVRRLKHFVPQQQDAIRRGAYEMSFLAHATASVPAGRPDVVVGVTPALGGAVAATMLANRYRARLVLVVQDLLGRAATQSGIAGGRRVATAVSRMESFAFRRADAIAIVSEGFASQLVNYGVPAERIHLIPNWTQVGEPNESRGATRARMGWADGLKVAMHTGNMGLKQDLGNIVEAARRSAHRADLRWVLMGDGSQRAALMAQSHGLSNLEFLPLCGPQEYVNLLAAADVLLINEGPLVEEMSLPSKLTSYFTSGRPVAGAVRPDGATARELARAGAPSPVVPGDPSAILSLVDRICSDPADARNHGVSARAYAQQNLGPERALARLRELVRHSDTDPV